MKAFILAAGFGKRMGTYTKKVPKPLLEIDSIKLLDYTLYLLDHWHIKVIIANTHYLSEQIENYFKSYPSLKVQISKEVEILGTGGGIFTGIKKYWKTDNNFLDEFIVINPDTVFFPAQSFIPIFPKETPESLSHLYLKEISNNAEYTSLFWKDGKVFFDSIPNSIPCYYIGLSLFKPTAFENRNYQINETFELGSLWRQLSKDGKLTGEIFKGDAIDIGEKELFEEIQKRTDFFQGKKQEIISVLKSF